MHPRNAYSSDEEFDKALRDEFAAQAMTGAQIWDAVLNGKNAQLANTSGAEILAEVAYKVADAMIAERNKP